MDVLYVYTHLILLDVTDENIEDALAGIVEQMQIDFRCDNLTDNFQVAYVYMHHLIICRKMRGFKGSLPNLAATVLYCLKVTIYQADLEL